MESISKESRIQMAIDAYEKNQFKTLQEAAYSYDVPRTTLRHCIAGIASRAHKPANSQILSKNEESMLSAWILDMDKRGLPLQLSAVRHLAQLLVSARIPSATIGKNWVNRYVNRHPGLISKYTQKYDYQRAKCENPELIKSWFMRVWEAIEKYGILEEDIYNMDETGFQMGVAGTYRAICGLETKKKDAKALQPGNREWVTAIICINAAGWFLPPQIIFAAANHQSQWYQNLPENYILSVSKNGWTTNELGIEWLQRVFEPNTASRTIGEYRLLILDGHGSHATTEFDRFCMEKKIIPLYMPPHSSHILQPLDVSCFSPLKHFYKQKVEDLAQKRINSIKKDDFLYIYPAAHEKALSSFNIKSGFAATGLVPLSPERVLLKFSKTKTPTPPSTADSSHTNQSYGIGKTPNNIHELEKQKKKVQFLENEQVSPDRIEMAKEKEAKSHEMCMHHILLLQERIGNLEEEMGNKRKRKQQTRQYIQNGGSLSVAEAKRQEEEQQRELERDAQPRLRRPPKCSQCGVFGHKRNQCSRQ